MNPIQIVLISLLLALMAAYVLYFRSKIFNRIIFFSLFLVGVVFVISPDLSNDVAHFVGVGRGADLILYCFVLITFVAIFNLHLRLRASQEMATALARAFAIATADRKGAAGGENGKFEAEREVR